MSECKNCDHGTAIDDFGNAIYAPGESSTRYEVCPCCNGDWENCPNCTDATHEEVK